jgi:hypothetical protein
MTRAVAWVRALTAGRRRVLAQPPRPAMVLAVRPVRPVAARVPVAVHNAFSSIRHEVHRHPTLVRAARAVTPPTPAAPPTVVPRAAHARGAPEPVRGPAGPPGQPGPPGPALVLWRAQGAAALRLPAAAAAVRAAVAQVTDAHRRVEGPARPLRALPIAGREPDPSAAARLRAAPLPLPARRPALGAAAAPAMVLRRAAAPAANDGAEAGRDLAAPRRPGAPAAVDLEALTDRVVAQIDRRIVAHRERLGQI